MPRRNSILNNPAGPTFMWWVLAVLVLVVAVPFFLNVSGDAQVHLAIAENFAHARPFQYNPTGDIVVASTSPFWTVMLTGFYWVAGDYAPLLLNLAVLAFWLGAAYLLFRLAREMWRFEGWLLWGTLALWLAHTTVAANALGGLENILSAFQLLWLALLTNRYRDRLTMRRSIGLGLLLGWTLLTRPDGGLFALLLLVHFALTLLLNQEKSQRRLHLLGQLLLLGLVAVAVLLPWYAYQFSVTGRLVTDSSLARLYTGRQGSLMLIPDLLYLHPKALLSLSSAFLPLAAGFAVTFFYWLASLWKGGQDFQSWFPKNPFFAHTQAVLLVTVGLIFYTFVVGAEAFGRYFLPLFPFFFLAGLEGLHLVYRFLATRRPALATVFAVLVVLFMAGTSLLDYARRVGTGRFTIAQVQDVVTGPANRQYIAFNLADLIAAPARRAQATDQFFAALGVDPTGRAKIAVTEVQLRYYLDERAEIISLDGRTSAVIQNFINPTTGVPDFAAYFQETRPDFVHVNQWCAIGGFLADLFTTNIEENLVCQWQQQTAEMAIGERFTWAGNEVVLVAPEFVQIHWSVP